MSLFPSIGHVVLGIDDILTNKRQHPSLPKQFREALDSMCLTETISDTDRRTTSD
jgi:hypothetical protein